MTSDQISQQIGAFQAQSMGQMQHASMLSQHVGAGHMASGMMGSMVNTAAAVGAPAAGLGLAIAGKDPISLGFGAGAFAHRAGMGLMGSIGVGAAAAGALTLPVMAAQWAGGQMLTGMQQQQGLDEMIRQTYGASSNLGRGGFSAGQMGQIGTMMRGIAATPGPQHQMTTFGELTQLMQGMSQMGMMPRAGATGPNLQEFTTRFRSMLKEVREVAHAFNTTLTEAQETMGAMRQSGIFKNQGAVAREMKSWALGGGIATTELSAMMSIGSQISRSIGGRGRAGAIGGMRTLGQVGIANQMGLLSEEDIYNVTGLTGAEGRQAYATQQMQQSASFLQSGFGRRFLASVAGKNGQLDAGSALSWMTGDIGAGETMAMARGNLGKVGRANFIRNEAKLRGAALEQFGGMTDVMALSGWLEGKGINLNDDRANVWLQRRMGWTEEQAEQKLQQMRNMPDIMRQQSIATEETQMQARNEERRSRVGIRGVKRKLEEFRHNVSNKFQEMGADIYKWGENALERWINGVTDEYYESISKDVGAVVQDLVSGTGPQAERAMERLGLRRGKAASAFMSQAMRNVYGGAGGTGGMLSAADMAKRSVEQFEKMDAGRFKTAGYRVDTGSMETINRDLDIARGIQSSALAGAEGAMGDRMFKAGQENAEAIRSMLAGGRFKAGGEALVARGGATLSTELGGEFQEITAQGVTAAGAAGMTASALRGAGVSEEFIAASFGVPDVRSLGSQLGGARTEADAAAMIGRYAFGDRAEAAVGQVKPAGFFGYRGKGREAATNKTDPSKAKAEFGIDVGEGKFQEAYGRYFMNEGSQKLLRDAMSENKMYQESAHRQATNRSMELQAQIKQQGGMATATVEQKAELMGLNVIASAADFMEMSKDGEPSDEKKKDFFAKHGKKWEDMKKELGAAAGAMMKQEIIDRKEVFRRVQERGIAGYQELAAGGLVRAEGGGISAEGLKAFAGVGKQADLGAGTGEKRTTGQLAAESYFAAQEALRQVDPNKSDEANRDNLDAARRGIQQEWSEVSRMDRKAQKEYMRTLASGGAGAAEHAIGLGQMLKVQSRLERSRGGGALGQVREVASQLGMSLDQETLRGMQGQTPEQMANMLMAQKGISAGSVGKEVAADYQAQLVKTLKQVATGDKDAAQTLSGLKGHKAEEEVRKKREADDPSLSRLDKIATNVKTMSDGLVRGLAALPGAGPYKVTQVKGPESCFVGDTEISMADGTSKPISSIAVGDEVLTADLRTGAVEAASVISIFSHEVNTDLMNIDGVVSTTNHPYFVGNETKLAEHILAGNKLYELVGNRLVPTRVHSIIRVPLEECGGVPVHAIHVSKNRNYFAGGFLVSQEC